MHVESSKLQPPWLRAEKTMKDDLNLLDDVLEELAAVYQEVPRVLHVDGDGDSALVLATLLAVSYTHLTLPTIYSV